MNGTLARWLLRAYPGAWRGRDGEEFEGILLIGPGGLQTVLDVLRSALRGRWSPSPQISPSADARSGSGLSRPEPAMSRALGLLLGSSLGYGPDPHGDANISLVTLARRTGR